jgi:hypothetical protein
MPGPKVASGVEGGALGPEPAAALGDSTPFAPVRANCLVKNAIIASRAVFSSFSSCADFSPRRARAALTVRAQ